QDLAYVLVDGAVVVDHEDAPVGGRRRVRVHARLEVGRVGLHWASPIDWTGRSTVKVAPVPQPSLCARSDPPISLAARAALWRPKPCPLGLVVNPCSKTRLRFSGGMPTPLSLTCQRRRFGSAAS